MRYIFDESKLDDVIRAAYALSVPQGLGYLHAIDGPLSDISLAGIKAAGNERCAASMDYVHGRAVKLAIHRDKDMLYIDADRWFDHPIEALHQLAERAQLGAPVEA